MAKSIETMNLLSWNVNGIRAAHRKGLDEVLRQEKPDIVCVQELKAQAEEITVLESLQKFGDWSFSVAQKRGYSGVATAVRTGSSFETKSTIGVIGHELLDVEGRWIVTEHDDFILYNLYFPSGTMGEVRQTLKYRFLKLFSEHLSALPKAKRSRLIICGDFNICHREIDIHHPDVATKRQLTGFLPDERKWMDEFVGMGFTDTFRHVHGDVEQRYTWWSSRAGSREKNLGWRIDYIFVSDALSGRIRNADILEKHLGSDHCPVMLELEI